jgi:hypothetical protein
MSGEPRRPLSLMRLRHRLGQLFANVKHHHEGHHDCAIVSYPNIICTKGVDDMSDHDEWISCSRWGMFTLERKSSRQSN